MTARQIVEHLLSYLRTEQRAIPHVNTDFDDPLPMALVAVNSALQTLAVASPLFAVKRPASAWFRAPQSLPVTAVVGSLEATGAWPAHAAGCKVQLPGDADWNRIVQINGSVASLQFPHQGASSGSATIFFDACELDEAIVKVMDPVMTRGGVRLRAASGRSNLQLPSAVDQIDYGRVSRVSPVASLGNAYFIESCALAEDNRVRLRMMLQSHPAADFIVGFNARCTLGRITEDMVLGTLARFDSLLVIDAGVDVVSVTSPNDMTIVADLQIGDVIVPYAPPGSASCTPEPLVDGSSYYVRSVGSGCLTLSLVEGGPLLNLTQSGRFYADAYKRQGTDAPFPIPNAWLETLFLPQCVVKFLSSPALQNFDVGGTVNANALQLAVDQVAAGYSMLEKMQPQALRGSRMYPGWG